MRVAINTTPLQTGHSSRGIGYYTKNLIDSLQKYDRKNEYISFTQGQKLPKVDLIHYPYFDLFFLTLPFFNKYPTVVTVFDVIPLIFRDKYPIGLKGKIKFQIQKLALKRANQIITISNTSKGDIIGFLDIPTEKIDVAYLAADDRFKPITNHKSLITTKKKYNLPDKFILYVGDVNYNKNLKRLLEAMVKINLPLVIVGKAAKDINLQEAKDIRDYANKLKISLKTLGFVPDKDLAAIYNLASLYVQPSLYEGFGLPVLEAMACGTPVVCSNTSSLSEVGGDAAIYVDPENIDSIVLGIKKGLKIGKSQKDKLILQSQKFSWEKTAKSTIEIYHKVLSEKNI